MRISIVGPTASGKTNLAIDAARLFKAVAIFSCDSMAVYRFMDLGTAKPLKDELGGVRYRLIDLVDPTDEFSIAQFRTAADAGEGELGPDMVPFYVGGSGLYHSAVFDQLVIPPTDPVVRQKLETIVEEDGLDVMYAELSRLDPLAASRINSNNGRRIIRALEVIEITGSMFSSFGDGIAKYKDAGNVIYGLDFNFPELDLKIEARVDRLIQHGWIDECRWLKDNFNLSRTARLAIGYRELFDYCDGHTSLDDAREMIIRRTKKLARRQRSWFKRDPRIQWFGNSEELLIALSERLDVR